MSRKTWIEVTCDGCGQVEHFLYPCTNEQLENDGYIVTGRKHFCSVECKEVYECAQQAKLYAQDNSLD